MKEELYKIRGDHVSQKLVNALRDKVKRTEGVVLSDYDLANVLKQSLFKIKVKKDCEQSLPTTDRLQLINQFSIDITVYIGYIEYLRIVGFWLHSLYNNKIKEIDNSFIRTNDVPDQNVTDYFNNMITSERYSQRKKDTPKQEEREVIKKEEQKVDTEQKDEFSIKKLKFKRLEL